LVFALGVGAGFGLDRMTRSEPAQTPSVVPSHIKWSPVKTVLVPSIQVGIGIDRAEAEIRAAGLTPVVHPVHTQGRAPFTFIGQAPEGGTVVLEGTAITLFSN
jgi:hypothetical protein